MNLNKHSRAGKHGTIIQCPLCEAENTVYHMAWCAITCQGCRAMVDKFDWRLGRHLPSPRPPVTKCQAEVISP